MLHTLCRASGTSFIFIPYHRIAFETDVPCRRRRANHSPVAAKSPKRRMPSKLALLESPNRYKDAVRRVLGAIGWNHASWEALVSLGSRHPGVSSGRPTPSAGLNLLNINNRVILFSLVSCMWGDVVVSGENRWCMDPVWSWQKKIRLLFSGIPFRVPSRSADQTARCWIAFGHWTIKSSEMWSSCVHKCPFIKKIRGFWSVRQILKGRVRCGLCDSKLYHTYRFCNSSTEG